MQISQVFGISSTLQISDFWYFIDNTTTQISQDFGIVSTLQVVCEVNNNQNARLPHRRHGFNPRQSQDFYVSKITLKICAGTLWQLLWHSGNKSTAKKIPFATPG